jgi:hypothetical protein
MNQALQHQGLPPMVRIHKGQMFYGLNEFIDGTYTMTRKI